MKTLVVGLGNDILSDDGVGLKVAREIKKLSPQTCVKELSLAGFRLIDEFLGFDRVILIDAIKTGKNPIGKILFYREEEFNKPSLHFSSPHDVDLFTALKFMEERGEKIPQEILIYAVEVQETEVFSEECTAKIKKVIPKLAQKILTEQF